MTDPGAPFWVPSAALQRHLNRAASGRPDVDWLTHVRAHHLPAALTRVLVVGCGDGFLERALARTPGAGAITGVDADAAAVERARRQAERRGLARVTYAAFEPDRDGPPSGPWDAILVHGVLHHAARPEELLRRLHDSLAPRGRLVFVEYVGPDRFRYSEAHRAIVDRYARLLPERLRGARPHPAALLRTRPHEAAHSTELLGLARRVLAEEAVYSGGGGLLHPLLSGLEGNFGKDPAGDEGALEVLCSAEARLSRDGRLPDAFAIFVGRRRSGPEQMT
jgi:SAM-dependent methyltransferase